MGSRKTNVMGVGKTGSGKTTTLPVKSAKDPSAHNCSTGPGMKHQ